MLWCLGPRPELQTVSDLITRMYQATHRLPVFFIICRYRFSAGRGLYNIGLQVALNGAHTEYFNSAQ